MQLDTFLSALARREATQAVLISGQPMRVLINGEWKPGAMTPSDALLDSMLQSAAPGQSTTENRFETRAGSEKFAVRVTSRNSARILVLTRLDASGELLAAEETAISAFASAVAIQTPNDFDRARGATPQKTPLAPAPRALPPLTQNEMFPAPVAAPLATVPPPIPGALSGEWYHAVSGQEVGPIPAKTMMGLIDRNVVRPDTMVWQQGMDEWKMAKFTELANFFSTRSPSRHPYKSFVNDSGTGKLAVLPDELKGFNSGAAGSFLFWCIAHNAWVELAMLSLTILLGPIFLIQLLRFGYAANEVAWRNRKWDDIEQFQKVQHLWWIIPLRICLCATIVVLLCLVVTLVIVGSTPH